LIAGVGDGLDAQLLERLRRGDEDAFDVVYEAHKDRLYRFLLRLCGRRPVAEDIFQETWLRLARHATTLRDDTDIGSWLLAVARNLTVSHGRWTILDARAVQALGRWWYLDAHPAPDEATAANLTLARLEDAFAALPATHREVLSLIAAEGLSHAEAARVLGVTPEVTRQRLARARAALADRMQRSEATTWKKTWRKTTLSSKA
jgi:RNA polymerase sigma-70 factor (ECF subfamily)